MFYLNNRDIEEMFREAAENYQLDTESAFDWEEIEQHLQAENKEPTPKKATNNRSLLFGCVLLISLGWLSGYLWEKQFVTKLLPENATLSANNVGPVEKNTPDKQVDKPRPTETAIARKNNNTSSGIQAVAENRTGIGYSFDRKLNEKIPTVDNLKKDRFKNQQVPGFNGGKLSIDSSSHARQISSNSQTDLATPTRNAKQMTIQVENTQKGFYTGLLFSPDITFIDFQKIQGLGTSVGLVAGYQINNKWSIETGIFYDKKKYYTNGSYFDKDNVSYLYDKGLISATGTCNMIEIPINIRYTFSAPGKNKWLAATGISSYFMHKETYDYFIVEDGEAEHHNETYYRASLAAVANLSVGYERKIAKNFNLRVEPYYKMPLSKIGAGNLYFSSAGLNLGIIKTFH